MSDFIRHYLTAMLTKTPTIREVYSSFKNYVEKNELDKEDLLKEILRYSKYYKHIQKASSDDRDANKILARLNVLDVSVMIPYLLNLWEYREDGNLSNSEFEDVLSTLEIYIFRRLICGVPTNALNKIFAMLHKDCLKYKTEENSYADVLKYVLNSKASSGRMPKNTEFITAFSEKDMYSLKAKNKWYMFDRLENMDTVERTNVIELMQEGVYTVEHIMPQTLSPHWKKSLGNNYQEVHDTWINRIANLTLTGYNSYYSNRPFNEKVNVEKGFKDSHLKLNEMLVSCEDWTEIELKKRNDLLQSKALKLWPYPSTDFKPVITINEVHSLEEDFNYKGRDVVSFTFMETPYSATTWVDMYQTVIKLLFELEPSYITQFAISEESTGLSGCFSRKGGEHYAEIGNQVYVWVHSNTMAKINNLKKLFEIYEIEQNELVFEITKEKETEQ